MMNPLRLDIRQTTLLRHKLHKHKHKHKQQMPPLEVIYGWMPGPDDIPFTSWDSHAYHMHIS